MIHRLVNNRLVAVVLLDSRKGEAADGVLTLLIKRFIEASLDGEMDSHLTTNRPNRRNCKGKKWVKTSHGNVEICTARDREVTYNPQLIPKRSRSLGVSLERKIISLYSLGMSNKDICEQVDKLYGMELIKGQLTAITDKVWPVIEEWRYRPLDEVYPFAWLDALFYKVKQDGRIKSMAAYIVLGIDTEGE